MFRKPKCVDPLMCMAYAYFGPIDYSPQVHCTKCTGMARQLGDKMPIKSLSYGAPLFTEYLHIFTCNVVCRRFAVYEWALAAVRSNRFCCGRVRLLFVRTRVDAFWSRVDAFCRVLSCPRTCCPVQHSSERVCPFL